MKLSNRSRLRTNQRGMVSIMVTMVIMIIVSLIVIGFAQLSRREQRQALDRQLSAQAFYAAETGINDAVNALKNGYTSEKTNCGPDASGPLSASSSNPVLDAAAGAEYTCLLIDPTPPMLEYASIDIDESVVVPLQSTTGALERIQLSWQDKSNSNDFSGCHGPSSGQYVLPPAGDWPASCSAGILRIDLVPRDTGNVSRAALMSRTLTAFLYPQNGAANSSIHTYTLATPDKGTIIPVNCHAEATPRKCNLTIQFNEIVGVSSYFLRVRSIYESSILNITGFTLGSSEPTEFGSAQAVVDSTGKANDVLRRISVRVPLTNLGSQVPDFAILTGDSLCKRFGIAPNVSPTPASGDPACAID